MTSTSHTTIATRITQCLAATALMAGLAIGGAENASAEPRKFDPDAYQKCLADLGPVPQSEPADKNVAFCCWIANGLFAEGLGDGPDICTSPPTVENVPGQPGQTPNPPVLQNPPGQPSNPLIPVPRGPNSGTLG